MIAYNAYALDVINEDNHVQIIQDSESMANMIDVAIVARNERNQLVRMVDVLAVKPRDFKIEKIEVNSKNISVEGFSVDTNTFKEYINAKMDENFFADMKIERITSENKNAYKTVLIRGLTVGGV